MKYDNNISNSIFIIDQYNGITIDSLKLSKNINDFEITLMDIIKNNKDKYLIWIKLSIEQSSYIPILTKQNFVFHHCNEDDLTLIKKLKKTPIVPTAKNHTLGVGAVVILDNKILVIKDMFKEGYKLPGGHIDNNENISHALIREVMEETGIKVEFESIVSLGHFTNAQFGESNLYILCKARALSTEINIIDSEEISESKWIDVNEFLSLDNVFEYNKKIVREAIKTEGMSLNTENIITHKTNELFF
jgi:8-oxo-dGTP diphosphatase